MSRWGNNALVSVAFLLCLAGRVHAGIIPIDLSVFATLPDPPAAGTIVVSPDGSMVEFAEDATTGALVLFNDPLLDPSADVIIPALNRQLRLRFEFDEPAGNTDNFFAGLFDANTRELLFEFFADDTSNGVVPIALGGFVGRTLSLELQLAAIPGDLGLTSTLKVQDVQLFDPEGIPEPPVSWLLLTGLGALGASAWRTCRRAANA